MRLLITLTGGGYRYEVMRMLARLPTEVEREFVTTADSKAPPELAAYVTHLLPPVTQIHEPGVVAILKRLFAAIPPAVSVVRKVKPDAIVCLGTSIAVPLAIAGRLAGCKVIFIESITRVTRPSRTGKILSSLRLIDRLYVQWPEAVSLYPRARYAGTVL